MVGGEASAAGRGSTAAEVVSPTRVRVAPVAGRITMAGCMATLALYQPVAVMIGLGALALILFVAVVGPAVWSRKPARRAAALAVLDRLLDRPVLTPGATTRSSPRRRG